MTEILPSVSAVIPCFNASATIERCLESILAQTHPISEILIYDDASTDDTALILTRMAEKHKAIRVIYGKSNVGAGTARTNLLKNVTGNYIAFLDADDVWHSDKISIQISTMEETQASICVCHYDIYKGDEFVGRRNPIQNISFWNMHLADWIPTSMAVLRSDLNGCREMPAIRKRQDYAYWLNLFSQNPSIKCVTVSQVLGKYYRIPGSLSSSKIANLKSNFLMFRGTQNYSIIFSSLCVLANVVTRIFRT